MAEQIDSPLAMDTDNLAIYASGAHRGLASLRRTSSGNLSSSSYGLGRTRSRRVCAAHLCWSSIADNSLVFKDLNY